MTQKEQKQRISPLFEVRRIRREMGSDSDCAADLMWFRNRGLPTCAVNKKERARKKHRNHWLTRGSESLKVRTGRRRSCVGDIPMTRLGGKVVSGESLLELDFLIIADAFESDLLDVIAQPFATTIVVLGRKRVWTPDFLVKRRAGHDELVEVKHLNWLYHPNNRALARLRLEAMAAAARERNCVLRVLTEDEIRIQPRLSNAKLIHRHCNPFTSQEHLVKAVAALSLLPEHCDISTLAQTLEKDLARHALSLAIRLERAGHIRIDRRSRYTFTSQFRKMSGSQEAK
jgi:hypothetical protein